MADNLIFPIKFDLEAAVREAQGDADRLLRRLQTTINAKPLAVNLKIPGAGSGSINEINSRLKELVKQWNNLTEAQRITNKTTGEYTAEAKKILAEYTRLRGASESYAQSLKQIDSAAKKAAKQQEKLAEAAYRGSNAFKNQEGYVSRLVKRLAVYASFQYTSQFLTNIREVTAQFELQRISLGAIIQDQQKANQIFAEIKSFALTSPLKILDLTKYAKQVAAYGFAADRVFDVTKRLADISVGLGVDMGRLSLAVSQIKAATALKASELRQLTETGLPMLDLLSKKLTETQGKLVSAADVMDLISKRAISYEMVEEILYDLTDAGGMFYNMQVKQSQTLFGMWSKLGDAAAIMYDQIGNTSSINAGMKLAIRSIESMMRNWKTTARVLDSVAVAMTVYIVGLKNAAVASKALTTAEATRLAITNKQIIATPKLIASIFGQNAATKLSTTLTKTHTAAMIRQSAATNVLTKGFWKLTAAMLANPWVAAAAGVALVVTALFHFIGNTETAAERAEKLNTSVASLKNLEDTTKPLIDTYNELINKTERTAEEQKKLSEVTHELAKQYPGAITAIGNFGAEVELAADKLNQLYQAEKQARMDNTRHELQETERQIASTEAKIAQLQKYLSEGKMWGGGQSGVMVAMSDEERARVLAEIDILRYGADGQSGLFGLQQSAEAARRALGLIPSEAAQAVEKFGAWKKKLTEFSKDVGGIKVKLFDDSTINQFGTLEEALDAAAKKYKDAVESVETNNKTLERGVAGLGQEQFDRITAERDEAQAMKELSEEALNYYNAMALLLKVMGGGRSGQSDPRLSILREMASTLKQVNKEYDELAKKEGATKALADTQDKYANTFKYLQSLATKYKFELPDFGVPTDAASLTKYLDAVKEAMKKLSKSEKAVLSLETDIADINMADAQKKIEAELKRLSDRISRTRTAKEFYEKILSTTGDRSLASRVAESIFGQNGSTLQKALADQVRGMTNGIELPEGIISADNIIDYKALRRFAEANKEELGDMYKELVKISEQGQKDLAKTYEGYLKDLEKAKTYSDKRIELARYTANQIAEINASTLPQAEKDRLTAGYRERERQEQGKLEWEAFKDMPMYVGLFGDLDHTSGVMLENMRRRLIELRSVWGSSLDPTELKELESRLREIDDQLTKRNPFKMLIRSIGEYKNLRQNGTQGDAERELLKAARERETAQERLNMLLSQEARLRRKYDVAVRGEGADSDTAKHLKLALDAMHEAVEDAGNLVDRTTENERAAQNLLDRWKEVKASIAQAGIESLKTLGGLSDVADSLATMTEALGGSEEDVQYWKDMAEGIGLVTKGIQDIVTAAQSGNIAGVVSGALGLIPNMISGFSKIFSAGRVKRANKEIKRQQELLDRLQYQYERLEKSIERAFGQDYIADYRKQKKNLEAQAAAYRKQVEAERRKGKHKSKDKLKEYENAYRDTLDRIADMEGSLAAQMVGMDLTSGAREFAKAWLEAYKVFGNTAGKMSERFKEMIENMVVEGALGRVMERALRPMYEMVDNMGETDFYNPDFWRRVVAEAKKGAVAADAGASTMMRFLEGAGIELSGVAGELSGMSRDIASASEEDVKGFASAMNTWSWYVSYLPDMAGDLAAIRTLMERGATGLSAAGQGPALTDVVGLQNQSLSQLQAIESHTAEMLKECRRIADACNTEVTLLRRVIRPKGSEGSHGVQVWT